MTFPKKRRGFTMFEVLTVAGLLAMLGAIISASWINVIIACDDVSTQTVTNTDAAIVIQRMVTDVREASNVDVLDSGHRLKVLFAVQDADYNYDRHKLDPNHTVEYYRSDSTGTTGKTGNWLWRNEIKGVAQDKRAISRDISETFFEHDDTSDMPRAVKITVKAANTVVTKGRTKEAKMVQRVVYMRNYQNE